MLKILFKGANLNYQNFFEVAIMNEEEDDNDNCS